MSMKDELMSNDRVTDFSTVKYEAKKDAREDFFSERDFVIRSAGKGGGGRGAVRMARVEEDDVEAALEGKAVVGSTKEMKKSESEEKVKKVEKTEEVKKTEVAAKVEKVKVSGEGGELRRAEKSEEVTKIEGTGTLEEAKGVKSGEGLLFPKRGKGLKIGLKVGKRGKKKEGKLAEKAEVTGKGEVSMKEVKVDAEEVAGKIESEAEVSVEKTETKAEKVEHPVEKVKKRKKKVEQKAEESKKAEAREGKLSRGGRNLLWLGAGAIVVAGVTTVVSLVIYHNSGDIYLDRSRPGYLPETAEEVLDEQYVFPDSGGVDADVLDEYLRNLRKERRTIEGVENPYGATPLSDESLGIPKAPEPEPEPEPAPEES